MRRKYWCVLAVAAVMMLLMVALPATASATVYWDKIYSLGPAPAGYTPASLKMYGGVQYTLVSGKNRVDWAGYDLWKGSVGSEWYVLQPYYRYHRTRIGIYTLTYDPIWSRYNSDAYIYESYGTYGYVPRNSSGNLIARAPGNTRLRWEVQGAFGTAGAIKYGSTVAKYYTF